MLLLCNLAPSCSVPTAAAVLQISPWHSAANSHLSHEKRSGRGGAALSVFVGEEGAEAEIDSTGR